MTTAAQLVERLRAPHLQTAETPVFNPLFQLSLEVSREIEDGNMSLNEVAVIVADLERTAFKSRDDDCVVWLIPQAPKPRWKRWWATTTVDSR